ncbi:tetratricopeptide repeat protein [Aporhodopirellula aestuarii]|uniref:Tetratricopeptide repeat protein n=1 Tax=Aporhodopirellula aestuarii TaxID=2950107 RepID=A0ABT0U9K4_9BACT|nr:hypothetical protein [Aporhodopirellula aestuarii]MCM2373580.1 hypothetical protein [Aporhodopirellula aestuarii]
MNQPPHPFQVRWLVHALFTVSAVALICRLLTTPSGVMRLFARWDVLVVTLLAVAPLSILIVCRISWRSRWQSVSVSFVVTSITVIIAYTASSLEWMHDGSLVVSSLARTAFAVLVMLVVVMWVRVTATESWLSPFTGQSWGSKLALVVIAIMVPATYADSIAEGTRMELEKALQTRRYALASVYAARLGQLNPGSKIQQKPIAIAESELSRMVDELEASLQGPTSQRLSTSDVGRRVTILMQLDRNEEALRLLAPLTHGPRFQPISLDYSGLCLQRLERFQESLDAYQAAVDYWQAQKPDPRRQASLASAWKGVGFAARRLNERSMEEHAYRQLVELAPTAENHMLLAQCYREHQKTHLASRHLSIAARLAPERKGQSDSMLSSMSTDHFGCWLVPRH